MIQGPIKTVLNMFSLSKITIIDRGNIAKKGQVLVLSRLTFLNNIFCLNLKANN